MNSKITTLVVAVLMYCGNATLFAASATWTWVGGTDVWTDKSNWSTTDNQSTPGNNDVIIFYDGAVTYPILTADAEVNDFIMYGGWFSTNGYHFESNQDITIYDGNFNADASLITADNIFLYGGNFSMWGDKFDINNDVVIDGGLFTIISANVSIPDDLNLKSGTFNLNGYNLSVVDEYKYEGGTLANPGTISINDLVVDFAGTLDLDVSINIAGSATFISGVINTTSTELLIFDNNASASGASDISHVNGPVRRLVGASGNTTFDFPTGNGATYAPIEISDFVQVRAQDYFTAQYFYGYAPYNHASKDNTIDHISSAEYWILDRNATTGTPTTDVNVRLSFDETTRSGIVNNATQLNVVRWDGTTWKDHGRASGTGNNTAGTVRTSARVTDFSPFTLGSTTGLNPLPVKLLSFDAKPVNQDVKVTWATASEINNDYFTVQRSTDGKSWSVIGIVNASENSGQTSDYNFTDKSPVSGVQFYRLMQTDLDGKTTLSNIVSVNMHVSLDAATVSVYPNPVTDVVNVGLSVASSDASVVIFNNMGMKVYEISGQSGKIFTIDMSAFEKGIYTIEIHHENGVNVSKLMKN